MTRLNLPLDMATAQRVLTRLAHAQRFPVGRLVPPVGLLQSTVRSMSELEFALRPEPRSLAGLDLQRLVIWIESDIGDPQFAEQVREVSESAPSYAEACQTIGELIQIRVAKARQLLGMSPLTQGAETSPS